MKKNGDAEKKDIPRGWKFQLSGEDHTFIQFGKAMARVVGPNGLIKIVSNDTVLRAYTEGCAHDD